MYLNAISGLRGEIVASIEIEKRPGVTIHVMIIRNPEEAAPFPSRPFSTHRVYERVSDFDQTPTFEAEAGHYDMTFEQAQLDLLDRAGWPLP